jgi:hypothetical protein
MGFGGGGSGSYSLQDHTHTSADEDGGELEEAVSLVDGSTLQTWWTAEYASAKHAIPTIQKDILTVNFTTASGTPVDVSGLVLTLPDVTDGKALVNTVFSIYNATVNSNSAVSMKVATVQEAQELMCTQGSGNEIHSATYPLQVETDGQVLQATVRVSGGGTTNIRVTESYMTSLEVYG